MKYGLILDPIQEPDFVLGAKNQLGGDPLIPDGQWDGYIPIEEENQNLNEVETMACASFGTLNCVEALERFEYGTTSNYSDRFLAKTSGTTSTGNSPQKVAETLRKKGCVEQKYWDFNETIKTFADFYKEIPNNLITMALQFPLEYAFGHEYVPSNYDSLMEALKYSPLGFSVYAWTEQDGIYFRPQGMSDNHWVCVYGYERNHYWKIFDSYTNSHKKIRWDCLPMQAKRYTLHRQVVNETPWQAFLKWFHEFLVPNLGARSSEWSRVRKAFLKENPKCAVCGKKNTIFNPLEAHHITPYSRDKSKELFFSNLITLCRPHHLFFGHLNSFRSFNSTVKEDASTWNNKIINRP